MRVMQMIPLRRRLESTRSTGSSNAFRISTSNVQTNSSSVLCQTRTSSSLPELETASNYQEGDEEQGELSIFAHAPKLRCLKIRFGDFSLEPTVLNLITKCEYFPDSDDFYHMPEMCPNLQHLTILDIPSSHEAQNLISVPPRKLSISSLKARATRLSSQLKLFQATLLSFIAPSLTALLMIGFNKYGLLSKRRKLNFEISAWAVEFFLVYTPTLPCLRSLTLSRSKIFDYEEFISTVRPRWLPDADAASKVGIKCLRSIELYFRHPFQGTDYVPLDLIEESGMRVVVKLESEEMRFFEIDPAEEEINSNAQEENSYEDGSTSELGSDDVE
ncbi:hypothetical protein F5876DRAFT_63881 [Lentinula aff. lateritia]|uniref:Uncharacterized protein n=1 Tax=Lentinula aff. lateritia TaxID=2804960 RepID=A0ACC1U678_9AGAR|nr:hypothetical protein F5876DRAFT_63881 [Lentinula aff. lateritia]